MVMTSNERKYLKALRELTDAVSLFLARLDLEMEERHSFDRGWRIAQLSTGLDITNDGVLHFTLDQSFQSINNRKAKMTRRARKVAEEQEQ